MKLFEDAAVNSIIRHRDNINDAVGALRLYAATAQREAKCEPLWYWLYEAARDLDHAVESINRAILLGSAEEE